jgi:uncharacterized membrane protein YagU involved in acid resistance
LHGDERDGSPRPQSWAVCRPGRRPDSFLEVAFFIVVQFVFLGILGAIFSLIVPFISSKRLLFKGALFGKTVWLILFSLLYLLQLPELKEVPLKTAVSHTISAGLWGIALAFILKKIDNKVS